MSQEKVLINRVAKSGIITFNLEDYYPETELTKLDIAPFLFKGLMLKEQDYRNFLKQHDWSQYAGKVLCVYCSTDAIIPTWAYMLVAVHAKDIATNVFAGNITEYLSAHYQQVIDGIDIDIYADRIVVIKGCSKKEVPASAFSALTHRLLKVVKSLMYGEPCSTVPLFKRKKVLKND